MKRGNSPFVSAFIRSPMLRAAVPFVLGLLLGGAFPLSVAEGWSLLVVVAIPWVFISWGKQVYSRRWLNGASFFALVAGFGVLWQSLHHDRGHPDHISVLKDGAVAWRVKVVAPSVDNGRSVRTWVQTQAALMDGQWRPAQGGVMLTLLSDSARKAPAQGDELLVRASVVPIDRAPAPGGFDVRQWAAGRGVYHQVFAPKENWARINETPEDPGIYATARHRINGWLRDAGLPDRERALVKALLLGQRDELQSDQTEAFVRSGTIHVLAVSGTHVGIIYGGLLLGLFWITRDRRGKFWRGLIILAALWNYAGLTGFAPSVLRATVMFSLFTIAEMTRWRVDSLNSLAAAAVLLLLWDPTMLGQLSFQLSFLAVLGIIVFYNPIVRLWAPPNAVLRYFWAIAAVSIAAQAFTAPLCLYVFRAFPVWFLPANMVVGGLIVAALYGGILLPVLQFIPVLGTMAAVLMKWLLLLLGAVNEFFAWLPWAYPAIRIGLWGTLGLYALLAFTGSWLILRKAWARQTTMATLAVLLFSWAWTAHQRNEQRYFAAYPLRDGFLGAFVQGRTLHLYGTGSDAAARRFASDHVRHAGIARVLWTDSLPAKVVHGPESYVFLTGQEAGGGALEVASVVLVTAAGKYGSVDAREAIKPKDWVIASYLGPSDRRRLRTQIEERGGQPHDLRSDGAYVHRR